MATLYLDGTGSPYTPPSVTVYLRSNLGDVVFDLQPGSASPPGNAVEFWFGTHDVVVLDVAGSIYYAPDNKVNFGRDSTQPDIPLPQPPPNTVNAWGLRATSAGVLSLAALRIHAQPAQQLDVLARLRAQQAAARWALVRTSWGSTLIRDIQKRLAATRATYQPDGDHSFLWSSPPAKDTTTGLAARSSDDQLDAGNWLPWDYPPAKDRGPIVLPWAESDTASPAGNWFLPPAVPPSALDVAFNFGPVQPTVYLDASGGAYIAPAGIVHLDYIAPSPPAPELPPVEFDWAPVREPNTRPVPADVLYRLPWLVGINVDAPHVLAWGRGQPEQHEVGTPWPVEPDPPDPNIPVIARLGVYVVSNSISVVRLPDQTPIKVLGVTASLDYTSWAWNVQITLADSAGLTLLTPTSSGPKEVQITINGFVLTAIAESYQRAWSFGKQTWVVSGRSLSAWLAAPYAPLRSLVSSSLSAASQLATAELNGTGWTLDWQAQDWNLDTGQWSYQDLAPIDAISKLAAAVGGTVQPDPSAKTLRVQSRYPVSPAGWAAATPDAVIPSSVLTKLGLQWQPAVQYNAAYLTGGNQGVNVNATLQATAGDQPIPSTISDPLLTAVEAGTERARIEIVSGGNKIQVSGEAPILAPVGVVLPGKLIEVDEAETWRGLVQATSIVAKVSNAIDVRQTLTIERRP